MDNEEHFIGYEYKNLTITQGMENVYLDGFPNFGWRLEENTPFLSPKNLSAVILKFKRDRKIKNKDELARLERQFEDSVHEVENLERSKTSTASMAAFTIGIVGAAFMAGSVFAFKNGMTALMIILAVPAFLGWIFPYFCYLGIKARRTQAVVPLIDKQYDAIYEVCEKAHTLLEA
jgi:hypothetical protein